MLDQLLDEHDHYLEPIPNVAFDDLRHQLEAAASRLGCPDEKSGLLDARLMVRYALNHLDPQNWSLSEVRLADGTITTKLIYSSPPEELKHFSRLEQESRQSRVDGQTVQILSKFLDLPGRLNSE